jgi:hypothetical protein
MGWAARETSHTIELRRFLWLEDNLQRAERPGGSRQTATASAIEVYSKPGQLKLHARVFVP